MILLNLGMYICMIEYSTRIGVILQVLVIYMCKYLIRATVTLSNESDNLKISQIL